MTEPTRDLSDNLHTSRYDFWNRAVDQTFFDGRHALRPVYLDLEPEVLAEAGAIVDSVGVAIADLTEAVKETLYLRSHQPSVFDRHTGWTGAWIDEGRRGSPPFLALLAFLSSIAEEMRSDERFASNNYYGRLCERIGLDPTGPDRDRMARCFRAETPLFWRELNAWLEAQEGRIGTPTAYSLDPHLKYVTVPISQALVRERDRAVMPDLFARYRLPAGTRLSRSDMLRFLEDWLPQAPVSSTLKRLWRQHEARERIADVACIELEMWDGTVREAEGEVALEATISLVAILHRHPRPRIGFDLVVRSVAPIAEGVYELPRDAPSHAVAALADIGGRLIVGPLEPEGWRPIEESALVSIADFLFANMRVERGDTTIMREPRSLVILERDEELMRYVEVPRAHLAREYLLLARERLAEPLAAMLDGAARPGYRRENSDAISGLPEGWVAFSAVELVGLPETANADLAPLVPVAWTAISLVSGFSLPARATWLRGALPEVVATSISAPGELAVTLVSEHLSYAEAELPALKEVGQFIEQAVFDLGDLELEDGDYRLAIIAASGDAALASTALRIRSAATPRVLLADQTSAIGCALGEEPSAALSASEFGAIPSTGNFVEGAWVSDTELLLAEGGIDVPQSLGVSVGIDLTEPGDNPVVVARAGDAPACVDTGAHYIVLPPAGRNAPPYGTKIEGECKLCGLEKWFPARPRGNWRRQPRHRPRPQRAVVPPRTRVQARRPVRDVAPIPSDNPASLDMLLEALSYAQRGRWTTFEALAAQVEDSALFITEVGRLLSSLGHIEIVRDRSVIRASEWAIAPTTIASLGEGDEAVLCGRRSSPLVDRIKEGTEVLGGDFTIEEMEGSPSRIAVRGISASDLPELAVHARSPTDDVRVVIDPAGRIASMLPPLSSLVGCLSQFTPPVDAKLERFDTSTGSWVDATMIERSGAYRSRGVLTRYGFASSPSQELFATGARLCKWLAAAYEQHALLAYDEATCSLICPLGAEPPGLYERALVLCSGRPPTKRRDGTTMYQDVPPRVAATLWRRLTG